MFAPLSPALKKQVCLCRSLGHLLSKRPFLFSFLHSSVTLIDVGLSTGTEYAGCVCTLLQTDNRGARCMETGSVTTNRS